MERFVLSANVHQTSSSISMHLYLALASQGTPAAPWRPARPGQIRRRAGPPRRPPPVAPCERATGPVARSALRGPGATRPQGARWLSDINALSTHPLPLAPLAPSLVPFALLPPAPPAQTSASLAARERRPSIPRGWERGRGGRGGESRAHRVPHPLHPGRGFIRATPWPALRRAARRAGAQARRRAPPRRHARCRARRAELPPFRRRATQET
jgi:hypothetical protein